MYYFDLRVAQRIAPARPTAPAIKIKFFALNFYLDFAPSVKAASSSSASSLARSIDI